MLPITLKQALLLLDPIDIWGKEGEREGEKHVTRERYIGRLPLTHPQLGTWPAIQACALTGNQTSGLLICRLALSPLSHISQGQTYTLKSYYERSSNYFLLQVTEWIS